MTNGQKTFLCLTYGIYKRELQQQYQLPNKTGSVVWSGSKDVDKETVSAT